jgi:galactonate dehydratase
MKIASVKPWIITTPVQEHARAPRAEYVFVQVDTDEGVTGWGEITTYPGPVANRAACAVLRQLSDFIKGDDPANIEAIWNKVFRSFTYMGTMGMTTAVVSAIDIALWDIRGKALGLPIYKLLGGPVRPSIPLYTHPPQGQNPAEAARNAKETVEKGYKALKTDPFMGEMRPKSTAYLDGQISARGEQVGVDIIAAIRQAVGPDVEILIDAHALYNVPTAIRLATRLAPYNIVWFEEPVPPESYHALKQVRQQVPVRICVGERLHTRFEFIPVFENHLADFIMPDVTWTGGISELKKISTLAEAYYVPVSPHDASGPVNIMAGAHTMMTVPNFYKLESSLVRAESYSHFLKTPLDIRDGVLHIPDRPGLGIEFDLDYFKANAAPGWAG